MSEDIAFNCIVYLLGNYIVIRLFTKSKELRTPANMFVVNLAISDMGMVLTQFPMFIYNCYSGGAWAFGPLACELYAATGNFSTIQYRRWQQRFFFLI